MYQIKVLILVSMILIIGGCSIMPSFFSGKKKDKDANQETTAETQNQFEGDLFTQSPPEDTTTSYIEKIEITEEHENPFIESLDKTLLSDNSRQLENIETRFSNDERDIYSTVISDLQDEITKLKSEVNMMTEEVYKLKAKSQIWENPFSIYNKEIILNNGSTVNGKITFQDQDILYVETLIGGLTIQRKNVKRVIENITQIADSTDYYDEQTRRDDILEIKKVEKGTIFQPSSKLLANAILLGDISEQVDFRGNRILSGDIKNIGEARADFVKINFIFRMNWQGKTKALTAFVRGSKHVFRESNIESDNSIELGAVAGFELVIPPDFGNFIGYSYSIDWEQYDD